MRNQLLGLIKAAGLAPEQRAELISEQERDPCVDFWGTFQNPEDPERGAQSLELLQEERELCTFCAGDEVSHTCLLYFKSVDFKCDPRFCRWNVHVAAEREAGDQCREKTDRLLENLHWPRVREIRGHQTVSGMHDALKMAISLERWWIFPCAC